LNSVNVTETERVYYSAMVVLQRTELGRMRLLFLLTIVLATTALVASVTLYSQASQNQRLALGLLGVAGLLALVLALVQLFVYPRRSHALLVQRGNEMVIATNSLHEGFKLRFLRDVLSENLTALSDEERGRWKAMEADGYYPALCVRNPRKVLILRLCTMLFDDVFAVDASQRWEHHDSASTAEPSFAKGERPRLKTWKELDAGSGPS